MTTEP